MIRKSGEALPCVHSRRQQGYKSVSVCVYDVLLGFRPSYGCDSADPASVCTQHAGPQEGVLCTPSFQRTHRGQAGGYLRSASGMCSVYRGHAWGWGVGETVTELTEQGAWSRPSHPAPGPGRTACKGAGLRGHFCPQLILTTSGVRARGRLFQVRRAGGVTAPPRTCSGSSRRLPHTRRGARA